MARPGWLNENANRSFPLLAETEFVPNDVVVDFGCTMGYNSGYREDEHRVWLQEVRRAGNTFYFEFQTDAPGCEDKPLIFTRYLADENATEYVEVLVEAEPAPTELVPVPYGPEESLSFSYVEVETSLSEAPLVCVEDPLWLGYLVTGSLAQLASLLPSGSVLPGVSQVEPALVQSLAGHYVRSVNLANGDRTRTPPNLDPECECADAPQETQDLWIRQTCLDGQIRFVAGYNCTIEQDADENTLTIGAGVGAGEGEPCNEIPLYDDETSPAGRQLLDGSWACADVIRSINGLGGPVVPVLTGPGVSLRADADNHTLYLDVNLRTTAHHIPEESLVPWFD